VRRVGDAAQEMLAGLLQAARTSVPDEVAALLAEQGQALGARAVTVYLVDHEQYVLVPLPQHSGDDAEPLSIEGSLAGRCFRQVELQNAEDGRRVWVPLLDGMERLGVVELEFTDPEQRAPDEQLHAFAALISELVLVKDAYGDLFARVRRRQPMSLAAEIAWRLLPPLTFGTDRLVIASVLAPAYQVGGDSFDYAVDATTAQLAVFDAMGHGLDAGWLATVAIGAYRKARRDGLDLPSTVTAVDTALADQFDEGQFVTAVLAELDLDTGRLRWHLAGHPAPLLLRGTQVVKILDAEPGDRVLLFTDGVIEARSATGELFGVDRLADLVAREAAAGRPAPETMRRLMHAILNHQAGALQDDATTMLVEWQGGGANRIIPESA
jgi:hypothetical protein